MKKRSLLLAVILILSLLLTACGASGGASSESFSNGSAAGKDMMVTDKGYGYSEPELDYVTGTDSEIYTDPNNKVIRRAELVIQTTEFEQAIQSLAALTEQMGGYYETAQVDAGGYYDQSARRSGYYVVRIPKENFTAFRDAAGDVGHIYSITESSQDVGETYYDTEARLETLQTKRDRLLVLLDKAEKMEDIITLENELADVQYEIDRHTATLRKYDSLIGFSTFTVRINEVVKITQEPTPQEGFGTKLLASFRRGLEDFVEGLQDFVLWFAENFLGVVTFVAAVAVGVVIVRKGLRRLRGKKKTQETE